MPLTEISNADDDKKFGHLGVSFFFSAWKRCGMISEIACEHSLMISFSARAFFFFSPAGKFDSLIPDPR